jgi:hypothetical protein
MIGRVAQVVECLPSKHKALSSNPSTEKIKENKTKKTLTDILKRFSVTSYFTPGSSFSLHTALISAVHFFSHVLVFAYH